MSVLNSILSWWLKKRVNRIERFMLNPYEAQDLTFRYLIRKGKNTEWGKKYDYKHIQSMEEYAKRVPISPYEDFYPYIERVMKGEQNILWPEPIRMFSKSSGTTNARSKFLPVSIEALHYNHYRGGKDIIAMHLNNKPDSKFFQGKSVSIGGSISPNPFQPNNKRTYTGDISAVIMKNLPSWAEKVRAPSIKTSLMDKWEAKIEAMVRETINEKITGIAGVPTWTIVLIQEILKKTKKQYITEVWKDLEFFAHGAVAFDPYRELFKKMIPKEDMRYIEIYNASEGFFALQDQLNSTEMLLMLDYGVYFEFIPMSEFGQEQPKAIPIDKVELNKNYAVVLSTTAGLWRYMIGDTVRFTSIKPYRIRITGRTKHFINAFGEEVIIENAEAAITKACKDTGAVIANFTAAPVYLQQGKQGGHEWVIEFEKQPESLENFTRILDDTLREINSDYDAKRQQDIALVKPIIHAAPPGTFYEWLRRKNKLGGQNKVPRLSNTREYIDEVLEVLKSMGL